MRFKDGLFIASLFFVLGWASITHMSRHNGMLFTGILIAAMYGIFYITDILVFVHSICARNAARAGHNEKVKRIYRNIYLISPESISGKIAGAVVLTLEKKWHHAEKMYREILAHRPHDLEMAYNLAYVLVQVGKIGEAIKWLKLIIAARPHWELPHLLLGGLMEV